MTDQANRYRITLGTLRRLAAFGRIAGTRKQQPTLAGVSTRWHATHVTVTATNGFVIAQTRLRAEPTNPTQLEPDDPHVIISPDDLTAAARAFGARAEDDEPDPYVFATVDKAGVEFVLDQPAQGNILTELDDEPPPPPASYLARMAVDPDAYPSDKTITDRLTETPSRRFAVPVFVNADLMADIAATAASTDPQLAGATTIIRLELWGPRKALKLRSTTDHQWVGRIMPAPPQTDPFEEGN